MTKLTITREQQRQILIDTAKHIISRDNTSPYSENLREIARIALAAMDSEPVEMPLDYLQGHKDGLEWASQLAEANHPETGDWLYDDPIELAKAIRKGPDMPPSQPALDSEPVALQPELAKVIYHFRDWNEGFPVERFKADYVISWMLANYPPAQPAPVVPELMVDWQENEFSAGWNACRAAMLQELKKSAGTKAICRSDENMQVLHTKSPAQSDCCPAQNSVTPAQGGNSLVIPDEMTSEQAYEIGYYYGDPVDVFARGANWMRQHIIDSTLAAAPQSPGSEPATVPGKWIPVSERMPEVGDIVLTAMGGVVNVGEMECSAANCRFFTSVISGRELPATHWLPLPAGPKEDINALIPLVSRNEQEGK